MHAFTVHCGKAAVLDRANVDTDQIIPKQFLKRIERTGFGRFLFNDWRLNEDGSEKPDFPLNQDRFRDSSVLVAGSNFGCGSSREHAPWALHDYGFRAVISTSFADIFYNNSFKNGLLPVRLAEHEVRELMDLIRDRPGYEIEVDLREQRVTGSDGTRFTFEVEPFRRHCLLEGLDDIGLTLKQADAIDAYERRIGRARA